MIDCDPKAILDKFATIVTEKDAVFQREGYDQVNSNKNRRYEDGGYNENIILWIAPKDCIRIEFEEEPKTNEKYITEIEASCKALKIDYCVTYHQGGKSPYLNIFNIKNMPVNHENKEAKLYFIEKLLPSGAKKQLDRTNLGWTLSPVIGHPHWKRKYNGAIHSIRTGKNPLDHNNEYPKDWLREFKAIKKKTSKNVKKTKDDAPWVEKFLLDYCCNNLLPAGQRHHVIEKNLALFIIDRQDKEVIEDKYLSAQGRSGNTLRTWYSAILAQQYTEVSAGELAKYIKENEIPFTIPKEQKKNEIIYTNAIPEPSETHRFEDFVDKLIKVFKDKEVIFYNPQDKSVVEVVEYRDEINKVNNISLSSVDANRLFNIINEHATITIGTTSMIASPPELVFRRLIKNKNFIESLPKMLRLLKVPTLFRIGDNIELAKEGYNPKLQAYLVKDAPKFIRIPSEKAKTIINALLIEFPFKEEIDKTMAIAGLLTPACRGLYTSTTKRSPLVLYEGNRAGVGKDYLAGCTHIIYSGVFTEQPALSSENKFGSMTDEEIRKKITASLRQGTKLLHYSNLRGELNSTAFEGFLTSENWIDRTLGSSQQVQYNNETDVSVSANTGFTFSNDMSRRMIKVRLFVDIEDITKRIFKNPDLHRKIKDNRGVFISAILSLIMDWNDAGRPTGNNGFTGFTDWANVVGGVMHYHGFGDPCQIVDYGDDMGDTDTMNARQVWELMAIVSSNTNQKEFTMKDITTRIKEKQLDDPQFLSEFNFLNDHYRASATSSFGKFFKKHIGRIHNGIKMDCSNPEEKTGSRKRYTFIFLE